MYISSSLNTVKTGSKNHDENNFASLFFNEKRKSHTKIGAMKQFCNISVPKKIIGEKNLIITEYPWGWEACEHPRISAIGLS